MRDECKGLSDDKNNINIWKERNVEKRIKLGVKKWLNIKWQGGMKNSRRIKRKKEIRLKSSKKEEKWWRK